MKSKSMKIEPRTQQKTMLKNKAKKNGKLTKNNSKMTPKKLILFWGKCLLGRLWWSKPFL